MNKQTVQLGDLVDEAVTQVERQKAKSEMEQVMAEVLREGAARSLYRIEVTGLELVDLKIALDCLKQAYKESFNGAEDQRIIDLREKLNHCETIRFNGQDMEGGAA